MKTEQFILGRVQITIHIPHHTHTTPRHFGIFPKTHFIEKQGRKYPKSHGPNTICVERNLGITHPHTTTSFRNFLENSFYSKTRKKISEIPRTKYNLLREKLGHQPHHTPPRHFGIFSKTHFIEKQRRKYPKSHGPNTICVERNLGIKHPHHTTSFRNFP